MSKKNKSPMIVTKTHVYFLYSTHPFSNFYPAKFVYEDEWGNTNTFNCSEQAYMYCKAMHFNDFETANEILLTNNPYEHKRLGGLVKGYVDKKWCRVRMLYMYKVNIAKFQQNQDLTNIILSTGNRIIVEASNRDLVWGSGVKINDPDLLTKEWTGDNRLGIVHGYVREYLRSRNEIF